MIWPSVVWALLFAACLLPSSTAWNRIGNNHANPNPTPLPQPLSGEPYHYLAYRALYLYDPNWPSVAPGFLPFHTSFNMSYDPEVPCPASANCQPCPTIN